MVCGEDGGQIMWEGGTISHAEAGWQSTIDDVFSKHTELPVLVGGLIPHWGKDEVFLVLQEC